MTDGWMDGWMNRESQTDQYSPSSHQVLSLSEGFYCTKHKTHHTIHIAVILNTTVQKKEFRVRIMVGLSMVYQSVVIFHFHPMLNSNDTIAMVSIILSAKWIPSGSLRNGLMALIIIIHRSSSAIVQCSKSLPYALLCLRSILINRIYTHATHIFSFIGIGNT